MMAANIIKLKKFAPASWDWDKAKKTMVTKASCLRLHNLLVRA